jgi:hypothetical protein
VQYVTQEFDQLVDRLRHARCTPCERAHRLSLLCSQLSFTADVRRLSLRHPLHFDLVLRKDMGNLFGSSKTAPSPPKGQEVTEKDRAVLELKRQRIRLVEYKKSAATVIDRETAIAKELLHKGDKKRALLALKKKKYQTGLLDKTDAQLLTVEDLIGSIEFAAVQQRVFEALKTGNSVLQSPYRRPRARPCPSLR